MREPRPDLQDLSGSSVPLTGRVFLVRHGRTALNADGRLRGHLDPPLDEVGEQQAAAVAAVLAQWRMAKIPSSPLLRALQTAQAIASRAEMSAIGVDELLDRDYGPWAGRLESEVAARFGGVDHAPDVEPLEQVATRSARLLEAQRAALQHGNVVLVAHDAVNKALLSRLDPSLTGRLEQPTGCWNEIRPNHDGWAVTVTDALPPTRRLTRPTTRPTTSRPRRPTR